MNHVVSLIGGVNVNAKTTDQPGVVYDRIPRARQQAALKFISDEVFQTPTWLAPEPILSRIGPQPLNSTLSGMQLAVLNQLTDARRISRLADAEAVDAANAYTASAYMSDLRAALWGGLSPDANRRAMQRLYLQRLATFIAPPTPAGGAQGQQQQNPNAPPPSALLTQPDVPRSDLPALARSELRTIRAAASAASRSAPSAIARAHWADVVDRIDVALEAGKK